MNTPSPRRRVAGPRNPGTRSRAGWIAIWLVWSIMGGVRAQETSPGSDPASPTIMGRVVAARGGEPLAGVPVSIHAIENNTVDRKLAEVRTDEEGRFRFAQLDPGEYALRTDAEGRALDVRAVEVPAPGAEAEEPVLIELALAFRIQGRVLARGTDQPLARSLVVLGEGGVQARTDDEGRFSLDRVPRGAGPYMLNIRHRDHIPTQIRVEEARDPAQEGVVVELLPGRTASFTVLDVDGSPVSGATVRVRLYRDDPYSPFRTAFEATTDDGGRCGIGGLPDHTPFVAEVRAEGYPTHQSIPFWLGELTVDETLVVCRNATLAGRVLTPGGEVVPGATVTVMRLIEPLLSFGGPDPDREDKGFKTVTTDEVGVFELDGLAYGAHRIRIEADGYQLDEGIVRTRAEAGETGLRFVLAEEAHCPRRHRPSAEVPGIAWESGVEAAFARARRERRPVFLAMAMDDEPANDGIARLHFKNPELIALSRYTCPLLSTAFDHTPADDPGGPDQRYGAQPSAVFAAVEEWARNRIGGGQVVNVPKHIFFDPERRELERRTLWLTERDLRNMMVRSLRRVNPDDAYLLASRLYRRISDRLTSPASGDRTAALMDLVLLANSGDELAAAMLSRTDTHLFAAEAVIQALDGIAPGIPGSYSMLVPFLEDGNAAVATRAAHTLARVAEHPDRLEALALLETTPHPEVRAELLPLYGIEERDGHLDFARSRTIRDAHQAAIVLARKGNEDATQEVLALVSSPDRAVRTDCALAAAALPGAETLTALAEQLQTGGFDATVMATALGDLGDPRAAPFLMLALKDGSLLLREEACRALGKLRVYSTMQFLIPMLEDPEICVRLAAAEALLTLGSEAGLPVLVEGLDRRFYRDRSERLLLKAYLDARPLTGDMWMDWIRSRHAGHSLEGGG